MLRHFPGIPDSKTSLIVILELIDRRADRLSMKPERKTAVIMMMCMRAVMTIFLLHTGNRLAASFASWLLDLQFFQFFPADNADSPAACLATEWAYFRPEPAEGSFIDFS